MVRQRKSGPIHFALHIGDDPRDIWDLQACEREERHHPAHARFDVEEVARDVPLARAPGFLVFGLAAPPGRRVDSRTWRSCGVRAFDHAVFIPVGMAA